MACQSADLWWGMMACLYHKRWFFNCFMVSSKIQNFLVIGLVRWLALSRILQKGNSKNNEKKNTKTRNILFVALGSASFSSKNVTVSLAKKEIEFVLRIHFAELSRTSNWENGSLIWFLSYWMNEQWWKKNFRVNWFASANSIHFISLHTIRVKERENEDKKKSHTHCFINLIQLEQRFLRRFFVYKFSSHLQPILFFIVVNTLDNHVEDNC